ncbi:hypothetical protein OHB53_09520 [Streptomyces sp. NBC_00056]|uniref:hypothetical protein n=1 Tax=Streptomyces sp. NBC_00056 TaxID=2975633 RepID=UPI0032437564
MAAGAADEVGGLLVAGVFLLVGFGSAGCNLTVEPDLTLAVDSDSVDPDAVYEITYEIHGDESGPIIETAELSDRTSLNFTPSVISTTSSSTKVSVEITDVSTQG